MRTKYWSENLNIKEYARDLDTEPSGSGYGPVRRSCEHTRLINLQVPNMMVIRLVEQLLASEEEKCSKNFISGSGGAESRIR
jgi:hypothetical protein